jgi:hypothetical protein
LLHARPSIREEGNIFPHATVPKTDPAEDLRHRVFMLACNMEEPLDQALAFARALDLMSFGLNSIADDHGPALLAIAEAMTGQLTAARTAVWNSARREFVKPAEVLEQATLPLPVPGGRSRRG